LGWVGAPTKLSFPFRHLSQTATPSSPPVGSFAHSKTSDSPNCGARPPAYDAFGLIWL
jgi:hypothetical protein